MVKAKKILASREEAKKKKKKMKRYKNETKDKKIAENRYGNLK